MYAHGSAGSQSYTEATEKQVTGTSFGKLKSKALQVRAGGTGDVI